MTSRFGTKTTLAATIVVVSAFPATARAGSLLSGYGGPGQGNQVILGAALLGGPSSGAGAGGSGSAAAGLSAAGAGGSLPATAARSTAPSSGGTAKKTRRGTRGAQRAVATAHVTGGAALSRADSRTFGISQADLVYIVIGLGGVLVAGFLTRHLAQSPR
jgi:hypothetical protein